MITAQQIALEIDKLQPDLKEFWEEALNMRIETALSPLLNADYSPLNTFKIDLLLIHHETHTHSHVSSSTCQLITNYMTNNGLLIGPIKRNGSQYYSAEHYNMRNTGDKSTLILTHVQNPRKYMSAYLKTATRETTGGTTAIVKNLEDNPMSLAIFTSWLENNPKPLNSVQALAFIVQTQHFAKGEVREEFTKAILSHCPKPSIELQKFVETETSYGEYQSINRGRLRTLVNENSLLAFGSVQDPCDSMFKPFVANLTVSPVESRRQLESVVSIALALLQENEYQRRTEAERQILIDGVIKFVTMPEHKELLDPLKERLQTAATAINKLLEML